MSPVARVLLGVALGSCITLLAHPSSRRYVTGFLPRPAEENVVRLASGHNTAQLQPPKSISQAGLWMQLGCEKLDTGHPISKRELQSLLTVARVSSQYAKDGLREFENAFWPQMSAVFLDQLGRTEEAKRQWLSAAKCTSWRDYQSARLLNEAQKMSNMEGPMAWQLAGLYYQRQYAVGPAILRYARKVLKGTSVDTKSELELRYATLTNANLMTKGAQSLPIVDYGIRMADLAVEGLPLAPRKGKKPKGELRTKNELRGKLFAAMNAFGMTTEAAKAREIYDDNDSRLVIAKVLRPGETAARYAALSVVTATLTGDLLVLACLGGVMWLLGALVLRYSGVHSAFSWPPTVAFGSALGAGVYSVTLLPLAGLVALLSALFLVFTPKNERSRYPSELGAVFGWTVGVISVLFIVIGAAFLTALSTPAKLLSPEISLQFPTYGGDRSILLGLAAIVLALLLLVAPMWAFARRIRTPFVLGFALRLFGRNVVALCLAGIVILGPLCVYADAKARDTLGELVGNEQAHYIFQFE
ncbi:MAG: hypothetical protein QOJ65_2708 [Fimbriimonadaceae bacterium]|nr:hypothetical protein [Fimbriimonadaceae bacterium]